MAPAYLLLLFLQLFLPASPPKAQQLFLPDHAHIRYAGRVDLGNPKEPVLIGSASYVEVLFSGDSCQVLLKKLNAAGEHNWISVELDGSYLGRIRLDKDSMLGYTFKAPALTAAASKAAIKKKKHLLRIFKATEAQNGSIAFGGIRSQRLHPLPPVPKRSIEFIGNSISCGMGIDWKEIPCEAGTWYDQHNAYWAYGPRVATALNSNFVLSSVSGIGMYRNWNSLSPVMPDVYDNLYLNTSSSQAWKTKGAAPDLVSICLGTNDFSDGDGVNPRLPFDSAQFVSSYIKFVEKLYQRYPQTQVCLLSSPMVSGNKGRLFISCLQAVQQHFSKATPQQKPIAVFNFESIVPHGCTYHPDREDHQKMAEALLPFYKKVMNW